MDCKILKSEIISGAFSGEGEQHLAACPSCRELYQKVNSVMEELDHMEPVPETLLASVMMKQADQQMPKGRNMNFVSYLQVAAAIIFGIFIGHKFGQNAKPGSFRSEADPVSQYIQAHHLIVEDNGFEISSLLLK